MCSQNDEAISVRSFKNKLRLKQIVRNGLHWFCARNMNCSINVEAENDTAQNAAKNRGTGNAVAYMKTVQDDKRNRNNEQGK